MSIPKAKKPGQVKTKQEIAAEVIDRFPDGPNRAIARILNAEYPTVFPSLEAARDCVRVLRGAKGDYHRGNNISHARPKPLGWQQAIIPPTASEPWICALS